MTDRKEFSKATRLEAWRRANGRCEKCEAKLLYGHYQFHHIKEAVFEGPNELDNCLLLCRPCHSKITKDRAPVIAKTTRVRNKHLGIVSWRKPMVGSKRSGWKKTFNFGWVKRD